MKHRSLNTLAALITAVEAVREKAKPQKPVIIGVIADNFDHYRWAKDCMERSPHFEKASFTPLLRDQDLRAVWSKLAWVLDYRVHHSIAANDVYHLCKARSLDVRNKYEVSKEYNLQF